VNRRWGYALIVCATFVAYWPVITGGMLWDDSGHVTRADLRGPDGLVRIWSDLRATQQYYPLLHSAFWVEHRLWGDSVVGYHLVNIALHALAACLVAVIGARLGLAGDWVAGLVWALHPICVESVAWISEQKSTLSGVFFLAAALAYLKFEESRRRSAYAGAILLFVAALLSKSVTAVLPGALLVTVWWRRGKIEWLRDVRPLAPWFAIGALMGLFTAWVESTVIGASGAEFALSPPQRVLLAGRAIWFYAAKILLPVNLTFFYPRWVVDGTVWWQWLFPAGVIAVAVLLWRWRGAFTAFAVFVVTLFPVLGFFNVYPFRYSFVADHFAYLASVAVIVPLVSLARFGNLRYLIAPVLGVMTYLQCGMYCDEETLYRTTIERNPDAWLAHNNLGNLLLARGNRTEGTGHIEAAVRLRPDVLEPHLSRGNLLAATPGRWNEAVDEYATAVRIAPRSDRAQTNLGNALLMSGRTAEAMPHLLDAVGLEPANAEAHNNLGNAYSQTGRLPDALAEYRIALRLRPEFVEAHNNLGRTLAQTPGGLPHAIAEFETAIRLSPGSVSAHNNLGNALSMIGRLEDAIAEYREALRLDPNFTPARRNLAAAVQVLQTRDKRQ